jgi:DNA adenine methylase
LSSPIKPVAPWVGGKRNLSREIIARIEAVPHRVYAEPFVGMGGIFLRRPERAPVEVINDLSRDVSTFFRVLQRHYVAFMEMMKFQLTSRAEFERLSKTDPETLTDLERSARFLYLQRVAYGGKVAGRNFGVSVNNPGRFDITKLAPMLDDLHTRLSGVVIERLGYAEFIQRYDRPDTLFYLDPPYFGCEGDYGADLFSRSDFGSIEAVLRGLKGRFILSLNDHPEVRRLFATYRIEAVTTTYTIAGKNARGNAGEVIISNVEREEKREIPDQK